MLGGTPDAPALSTPRAMEPAGARLSSVGMLGLDHPGSTPSPPPFPLVPLTQLSRHYPVPPGLVTAWGAGDALWGGTSPYLPQCSSKGSHFPSTGSTTGKDGLFLPLPGAWKVAWGPQGPHNSLYIFINKWDFNGDAPMSLSLCGSLSVSSPSPPLLPSISFFLGFHPESLCFLPESCLHALSSLSWICMCNLSQ